ncbi:uncharacterized protein LOC111789225 [Cucurbita pepo subsp. pepo]|uniref:uncharacterized protein LOC111789225 n=1 Tax=Cucurbita pepo subsp. pepo TaxID=3664 RepID=UPI000C9D7C48|nr:uncharacterized protein LOC111789225 [Cucurbita pepo subsp. pepo]
MADQNNNQTLQKVTKLLFSISLLSFFFILPSWLFHSPILHSSNQPIDKNFMFLLCNGLLVFLAKYSGLFKSLSTFRPNYDVFSVYELDPLSPPTMLEDEKQTTVSAATTTTQERNDESEERTISIPEIGNDEVEEHDDRTTDEDGNDDALSDEELNRKFDEFIKRMKEEIIEDAQKSSSGSLISN